MKYFFTALFLSCVPLLHAQVDLSQPWKFKTGDDPRWADPGFADSDWPTISVQKIWEEQNYANYDGFAWYRLRFFLPESLKTKSYLKEGVRLLLGKIDDADAVFLNGNRIGGTGQFPELPGGYQSAWDVPRRYLLPADHPALRWNAENVLAVRVYDGGGAGGFFGNDPRNIDMTDLIDFVTMDAASSSFDFSKNNEIQKTVRLDNSFSKPVEGKYRLQVFQGKKSKPVFEYETPVSIRPGEPHVLAIAFPNKGRSRVVHSFTEKNTGKTLRSSEEAPYLLTPPESPSPRINNADTYGARPGVPFLYKIAASGQRPMSFEAKMNVKGLVLDPKTGIISGSARERGAFPVTLKATNSLGSATKTVVFFIGDNIALTPPLGWNSWNCWGLSVSDEKVRSSADAMISSGLANHGWTYMNIDDGWEAPARDPATGEIRTNEKFPDMKALADYIHSLGLKIGIYSSPGPLTCGGYLGSWQHEQQDAHTWANWGIDYLKYDWCSYGGIAPEKPNLAELKKPYEVMRAALNATNRDIVYSLCQYGMGDVWQWGEEVGGNLWRTTGDITDTWESLYNIGFQQDKCSPHARPGHWNDPDMLIVGRVGWGDKLHPTRLTPSEQYTHISLWALLSAPLLIGCDLSRIDDFTYNLLANDEVLAINQDALGYQAAPLLKQADYQIWSKELADGSRAVGIFNLSEQDREITVNWAELGLSGYAKVRDVWRQKDMGKFKKSFSSEVFSHGAVLIRLTPAQK